MNILVVGAPGSGKSKLGDLIRNTIFKFDENSRIITTDPDRENRTFGVGKNTYNIEIRQVPDAKTILDIADLESDIVIVLTNDSVSRWFKEIYE